LVERNVEEFLVREGGTTNVELVELLQKCQSEGTLTCMDYLLASTEYDAFLRLVSDFKGLEQWGGDDETLPGQLLGGLEDDDEECSGGSGGGDVGDYSQIRGDKRGKDALTSVAEPKLDSSAETPHRRSSKPSEGEESGSRRGSGLVASQAKGGGQFLGSQEYWEAGDISPLTAARDGGRSGQDVSASAGAQTKTRAGGTEDNDDSSTLDSKMCSNGNERTGSETKGGCGHSMARAAKDEK